MVDCSSTYFYRNDNPATDDFSDPSGATDLYGQYWSTSVPATSAPARAASAPTRTSGAGSPATACRATTDGERPSPRRGAAGPAVLGPHRVDAARPGAAAHAYTSAGTTSPTRVSQAPRAPGTDRPGSRSPSTPAALPTARSSGAGRVRWRREPGTDHMDVYLTHGPAASVDGPFAEATRTAGSTGARGHGRQAPPDGAHHTPSCTTPPNHTTKIFCYDQGADRLCTDGEVQQSTEPEAGVWKDITAHPATINAGGCDAWGNVGAARSTTASPWPSRTAWATSSPARSRSASQQGRPRGDGARRGRAASRAHALGVAGDPPADTPAF